MFEIDEYFKGNEFLRVADAGKMGISRAVLAQMAKRGELQRVAQGVYARADAVPDELALIGMRSDNIVFSHETALNLHGLSNRIPARPSITIPYGGSVPHSIAGAVNAYRIRPQLHDLGRVLPYSSAVLSICLICHIQYQESPPSSRMPVAKSVYS